jgi:hypothetical protein
MKKGAKLLCVCPDKTTKRAAQSICCGGPIKQWSGVRTVRAGYLR